MHIVKLVLFLCKIGNLYSVLIVVVAILFNCIVIYCLPAVFYPTIILELPAYKVISLY